MNLIEKRRSLVPGSAREDWGFPRGWHQFFRDLDPYLERPAEWQFNPSTEIEELEDRYRVSCDLPGLRKEDIKIDLHDNRLTLSGERKTEEKREGNGKTLHFSEVKYGSFFRSFTLPTTVDSERVSATFKDGVLTIEIPKAEASRARNISIR